MAHLLRQPADRRHDPARRAHAQRPRTQYRQHKAGRHDSKKRPFPGFEIPLALRQYVSVAVASCDVGVVSVISLENLIEAIFQVGILFWNGVSRIVGSEETRVGIKAQHTVLPDLLAQDVVQLAS